MTTSAAALGLALASSFGSAAWAQSDSSSCNPGQTLVNGKCTDTSTQEIVVTGSRIARRDFTSNSPIVTLDSQKFENNANVAIEATLNKLPQFSPGQQMIGADNSDISPSPTHTVGISTANLRNLGANRNLVLVDGRRQMPVNGLMVVDLNSIPSSMIDHVETISGGASAVYGPDAVSGVVNFILKKNYQGLTVDSQYGEAAVGDDQEFKLSALMGTNFADDRGNVTIGLEHYTRGEALYSNREFYQKGWADPTVQGLAAAGFASAQGFFVAFPNNSGFVIPLSNCSPGICVDPTTTFGWSTPNTPLVESRWANYQTLYFNGSVVANGNPAEPYFPAPTPNMYFNNNGTMYPVSAFGSGLLLGSAGQVGPTSAYQGKVDGKNVAYVQKYDTAEYNIQYQGATNAATAALRQAAGPPPVINYLKWNDTYGQLLAPLTRYSSFASGHYDLTDNLSLFMQGNFSTDTDNTNAAPQQLDPTSAGDILVPNFNDTSGPNTPISTPPAGALYPTYPVPTYNGLPILGCPAGSAAAAAAKTCATSTTETLGIHFPVPTALATLINNRFNNPAATGLPTSPPPPAGSLNLTRLAAGTAGQSWDLGLSPPFDGSIFPRRQLTDRLTNYQFTMGFDGKLPAIDWSWELFASYGQSTSYTNTPGNVDLQRLRELILYTGVDNTQPGDVASVWGKGASITGNQLSTKAPGSYGSTVTCTSGWYNTIFFNQKPSQDCLNAVLVDTQTMSTMAQNVVEFDAQGHVFDLPAGEVRGSIGAAYRDDSLNYQPDSLTTTTSFVDQVAGQYPTAPTKGSIGAREGYGELLVPVLKDLPGIKSFSLDLGARFSTYTNTSNGWTYMATGDWQVLDWLRFSGGYNLAVRAPSVGEAFQAKANTTPATDNDPCTLATDNHVGAGGADDAQLLAFQKVAPGIAATIASETGRLFNVNGLGGAETTYAICRAQMGVAISDIVAAGPQPAANVGLGAVGGAAQVYYNTNPGHSWYEIAPPSNTFLQGNPNLAPEIGKTWTVGTTITSPFKTPLLERATLRVDWYSIIMNHTINQTTATQLAALCYQQDIGINKDGSGAIDPAKLQAAVNNPACALTPRNPANGNWDSISLTYANLGYLKTQGFDAQFNWGADFADIGLGFIPGSFSVNELANYLMHFITNCNPSDPTLTSYDWAGSAYNNGCGSAGTVFRYQTNTTFSYVLGPATISINWRHLPGYTQGAKISYRTNAAIYKATGSAYFQPATADAPYTTFWTIDPASHDEFDLSATYALNDHFTIRGGVDNLLDAQPEVTGGNTGGFSPGTGIWQLPTTGNGTTNAQIYDTLGRRYYFGITAKF